MRIRRPSIKRSAFLLCGAAFAAGCVSYDGRGLVSGKSTASDVESVMGPPAEKVATAGGDSTWFYPHAPAGRDTYAVRIGPDGVVRAVEQRLTEANMAKLVAGTTTVKEVRELLGPPNRVFRMERQQREAWEYLYYNVIQVPFFLYVQASPDGIVREVLTIRDPSLDAGTYSP
jgi:hypothetical protein